MQPIDFTLFRLCSHERITLIMVNNRAFHLFNKKNRRKVFPKLTRELERNIAEVQKKCMAHYPLLFSLPKLVLCKR